MLAWGSCQPAGASCGALHHMVRSMSLPTTLGWDLGTGILPHIFQCRAYPSPLVRMHGGRHSNVMYTSTLKHIPLNSSVDLIELGIIFPTCNRDATSQARMIINILIRKEKEERKKKEE